MEISILEKEEACTFDELDFLRKKIVPNIAGKNQQASIFEALGKMMAGIENHKDTTAIFFMPQNTFNIFSIFQGDGTLCDIQKEDTAALCSAFDLSDWKGNEKLFTHMQKKIKVLNEYLQAGNAVSPTPIQADNFSKMQIS